MIQYGEPPFLECSTKGDRRFSAFCAYVEYKGKTDTIEAHYQAAKVFDNGETGLNWRQAKGRKPVNIEEVAILYGHLWDMYIQNNLHLCNVLIQYNGVRDIFGQYGHQCQATELWRIRQEYINWLKQGESK